MRIKVARKDAKVLRRAVKAAKLPRLQRKVRWVKTRSTLMLVVRNTRTQANEHNRGIWVGRITSRLKKADVKILLGQF